MPDDLPPSLPSLMSSQPINPYKPGDQPAQRLENGGESAVVRQYHVRLEWSDRRAFLRSLFPLRLAVVATSVHWLASLVNLAREWSDAFISDDYVIADSEGLVRLAFAAAYFGQGALFLYFLRLNWQYSNSLQYLAGGATGSFVEVSRLTLRLERISAALAIIALGNAAAEWAFTQWELSRWSGL